MINYRIRTTEGYSDKIGELVSMLEHARAVTLADLKNLTQEDLDFLPDETSNSIGSLLLHIASIEFVHQVISFEKRDPDDFELLKWGTALELGEKAQKEIKDKPLEYYLSVLEETREKTLRLLRSYSDSWLYKEQKWDNGVPFNNYWMWYHVMEDEISHRGQIRTIKRVLSKMKAEI